MIRVLFVCLGNICRSPMAEAVFRELVKKEGLENKIEVDSAGTGGWHVGEPPHEGTVKLLAEKAINTEGMKARQIIRTDSESFQYIIVMDHDNLINLKKVVNENDRVYIAKLLDFVKGSKVLDVPDPYFTGNFDEVYDMVESGSKALLSFIKEREHLNE